VAGSLRWTLEIARRIGIFSAVMLSLAAGADAAGGQRAQAVAPVAQRAQTGPLIIEAESLAGRAAATDGAVSVQTMSGFGAGWSNGAQLFWRAPDPGGPLRSAPRLTLTIAVPAAGEYLLAIRHSRAPDYGDVRVFVGGNGVGGFEGFAARVQPARTEIGRVTLTEGANAIILVIARRPPGSAGSFVGLDAVELIPTRATDTAGGGTLREGRTAIAAPSGLANAGPVLPPGAKLYRFAHQNLDAPPTWADSGTMDISFYGKSTAKGQFKWDVTGVTNATAIAYQVTSSAFPQYTFGEPLQQKAFVASGYRTGSSGQLTIELPLIPPQAIAPANKAGMMADYQVRVLPLLSLTKPQVVGAPSNVLVVRTYAAAAPGLDIKIKTWKVDPTVDVVKFTWAPYKYTAHWPPGCTPAGSEPSDLEAVVSALSDAWNWFATAYADAKNFVVNTVVSAVALIPPGIKIPKEWVSTALDGALMAAGVPPNIPNLDKLMTDGADFLAQQMVDQIPVPAEVAKFAGDTGIPVDQAIDDFKNKVKAQAKTAILDGAKKAKAAAESQGGSCRGLREYEYIKVAVRNTGPAIQKDITVEVDDSVGAFKGLSFSVPSLAPGEEIVVPRYLYSPEHLNRPTVTKWQFESDNLNESWTLWNNKYFKETFTFRVRVLGFNCASAGQGCVPFPAHEYTTPARPWGKENGTSFSWP
jgi:hypothetical protein